MVKKLVSRVKFAEMAGVSPAAVTKACKSSLAPAIVGKKIDAAHHVAMQYLGKKALAKTPPAAPGIDLLYKKAVEICKESGNWSVHHLQGKLNVGRPRAMKLIETMKINNLVPAKGSKSEAEVATKKAPEQGNRTVSGKEAAKQTKKDEALASAAAIFKSENVDNDDMPDIMPENLDIFADMTLREIITRFGTDEAFYNWLKATKEIEAIHEKRLKNAATKGTLVSRALVHRMVDLFNSAHLRLLKDGAKSIAAGVVSKHSAGSELGEIEQFVSDILGSFIRPMKNKAARALKSA